MQDWVDLVGLVTIQYSTTKTEFMKCHSTQSTRSTKILTVIPRWYTHPKTVANHSTNRTQRRVTSFMRWCDERRYNYAKPPTKTVVSSADNNVSADLNDTAVSVVKNISPISCASFTSMKSSKVLRDWAHLTFGHFLHQHNKQLAVSFVNTMWTVGCWVAWIKHVEFIQPIVQRVVSCKQGLTGHVW